MSQKPYFLILALTAGGLGCKTRSSHGGSTLTNAPDSCLPTLPTEGPKGTNIPRFSEGVPSAQSIKNAGVNGNEIKAVHEYTASTDSASYIQDILQTKDPNELASYRRLLGKDYVEIAHNFKSAVTKISTQFPFQGTVWRGIVVAQYDVLKLRQFYSEKKPIGLGFDQSLVFTSTSRSKEFATSWAQRMSEHEQSKFGPHARDKKLIYEIKQCRGAPIETIEPLARGKEQMEVILLPSTFTIMDIKDHGPNTVGIVLEEQGCKSTSLTDLTDLADRDLELTQDLKLADTDRDELRQDPILKYFDFEVSAPDDFRQSFLTSLPPDRTHSDNPALTLADTTPTSFSLTEGRVCPDRKIMEKVKNDFNRLDDAAKKAKTAQIAYNKAPNAEAQEAARSSLKAAQIEATQAAKSLAPYMKSVRVVRVASGALKLVPVVGFVAEGAALGMGIAEAIRIKQQGGSDSEAAAAVLSGLGIIGAIPALLACENCTPDEQAAAFFSGFFGFDFSSLVICPGKRCPHDLDLAGYDGDWSLNRIKRSCPRGVPALGTSHDDGQLNVICSSLNPTPVSSYRYVDNARWENRWSYDLHCGPNEYLAGVSFLTSRGTPTYGIKSILCATRAGSLGHSCSEVAAEACPSSQYLRGIFLDRAHRSKGNMGTLCSKAVGEGRDDDQFEYCDHVRSVLCCNILP